MLNCPMDILKAFPVRKSKKQKESFRNAVIALAEDYGYSSSVEKGSMGCRNLVIGDPDNAKYLVTAHYDTPAGMPFPNLITPCNFWGFLGYQAVLLIGIFGIMGLIGFVTAMLIDRFIVIWTVSYTALLGMLFLMIAGPANKNNANDNTSGVVAVLEMARTMPELYRDKVCFVLFDLEELGLVGSSSYRSAHKKVTENQIVLNLDCVGDGNEILFFPTKKFCRDHEKMAWVCRCVGHYGDKSIAVRSKGFRYYPSDQKNFPYGVGIAAFRRSKWAGLYCSRIHTNKDTILEETNVNILRAAITTLITGSAAD